MDILCWAPMEIGGLTAQWITTSSGETEIRGSIIAYANKVKHVIFAS